MRLVVLAAVSLSGSFARAATETWSAPIALAAIDDSLQRRSLAEIARFSSSAAALVFARGQAIHGQWYETGSGTRLSTEVLFSDSVPSSVTSQVRKASTGLNSGLQNCSGNGTATYFAAEAGQSVKVYRAEICNGPPKAVRFVLGGSVSGDSSAPSIAVRGADGVLVYARSNQVYSQRLNMDGSFNGAEQLIYTDVRGTSYKGRFSDLIWNGSQYILAIAMVDGYDGLRPCLTTMNLSTTGTLVSTPSIIGECHGMSTGHFTSAAYKPNAAQKSCAGFRVSRR